MFRMHSRKCLLILGRLDECREDWVYAGMVQMLNIVIRELVCVHCESKLPAFDQGGEFAKTQTNKK